ncbi:four helix bundle protein [Patescibacteria group bacterium]|nr:four helix bundle protein [Patescibacteria group bacterium]
MENFKKLKVWLKAHQLVKYVYQVTDEFPKSEMFALTSQMRRSAISIPANIAEGSKRKTVKDRRHFLVIAQTSLEELKYYFLLSYELGYIEKDIGEDLTEKAREIGRMLTGLSNSMN